MKIRRVAVLTGQLVCLAGLLLVGLVFALLGCASIDGGAKYDTEKVDSDYISGPINWEQADAVAHDRPVIYTNVLAITNRLPGNTRFIKAITVDNVLQSTSLSGNGPPYAETQILPGHTVLVSFNCGDKANALVTVRLEVYDTGTGEYLGWQQTLLRVELPTRSDETVVELAPWIVTTYMHDSPALNETARIVG